MKGIKGVIVAAGMGTRLFPLTKIINKQLLPIYDEPLIHFPVRTLHEAGIDEILIISGRGKSGQFVEYFADHPDFADIKFHYTVQPHPGGIAHALSFAKAFAGEDKIAVILGDNIFEDSAKSAVEEFMKTDRGAKIFLKQVPDARRFGCPEFDHQGQILRVIEKPKEPPSNYCVTGLYLYDNRVWEAIEGLKPSDRGELEVTDLNNFYIYDKTMSYATMQGAWYDAGTFQSLLEASLWQAKRQGVDVDNL